MSTVANYVGRTVDVVCFHGTQLHGDTLLEQTLAPDGESGQLCTGIVKLGQRFLMELLTPLGSIPFRPSRGSTFMREAQQQLIRTQVDLFAALSRGLLDVARNLRAYESDSDPDDERFASAEILNVTFTPGEAVVSMRVRSRDPNVSAILPINVSLR